MPTNAHVRKILFVTGPVQSEDDTDLVQHLRNLLGYQVTPLDCRVASAGRVNRQKTSLIIISPTATEQAGKEFRDIEVPVVVMSSALYPAMGLTGSNVIRDFGVESRALQEQENQKPQVHMQEPNHPIVSDLRGSHLLAEEPADMSWGLPNRHARKVVTLTANTNKAALFCYDSGDTMVGLNAPARRVAILYNRAFIKDPGRLYWRLFDAAVEWAAAERPRRFPDVFRAEWSEILTRREAGRPAAHSPVHANPPTSPPQDLAGLALSGGGIRAATFSLGLLQAMNFHGVLRAFDYLSTVSGGGYVGGWWSAWLSRDPSEQGAGDGERVFPPPELIKPEGEKLAGLDGQAANEEVADELLAAGRDPVHHLRLFSNYLTPRKGVLSPDTWRAVTVISRDMALTWVVLLPVLIAALLLGKLYFVLQPLAYDTQSHQSFFQHPADPAFWEAVLWSRLTLLMWPLLLVLGWIVVAVCAWMVSGGAEESRREWWAGKLGATVVVVLAGLFFYLFYYRGASGGPGTPVWFWPALVGGSVLLLVYCFFPGLRRLAVEQRGGEEPAARQWRGEVLRYRIARTQSYLIVLLAVAAFVLVLAGFGHELVNYVLEPKSGALAKAGGGLAVLSALAGSVFTALKNSPSGGSDERLLDENESAFNRLVFRITPPLLILVLAVAVSWATNALLGYIHGVYLSGMTLIPNGPVYSKAKLWLVNYRRARTDLTPILMAATCVGALLSLFLVLVETRWRNAAPRRWLAALWIALAFYMVVMLVWMLAVAPHPPDRCAGEPVVTFLLQYCQSPEGSTKKTIDWACLSNLELCLDRRVFAALFFLSYVTGWGLIYRLWSKERRNRPRLVTPVLILLVGVLLTLLTMWGVKAAYDKEEIAKGAAASYAAATPTPTTPPLSAAEQAKAAAEQKVMDEQMWVPLWFTVVLGGALIYCLLFVLLETLLGSTDNRRAMWLLTAVYLALNVLLGVYIVFDYSDLLADYLSPSRLNLYITVVMGQATFGLFGVSLTWVVAMGWMADPNRLSLHHFYRARLVRAYLGASNKNRSARRKTIREAVEGDDVLLQDLGNCKRGAPYHLVNTTLNLVGGRDLTTAQRSAASFVLSKRFCGSSRTGYRDTREYMDGRLSLGTAVAVSGAAASPNMGSKTLTSSLAMLMTFLNVRLGYWAPTPNKKDWRETKARLWPFYMLREFTSQTNDLSTYCYLTDGGHFDNTGLYALVERGCHFIVVADCGADPKPCFQDVGDALRRCRIDFGSEIDLDLAPVTKDKETGLSPSHFTVGSIVYSYEHAKSLGWTVRDPKELSPEEEESERLARTGVIILFKPAVTSEDEPADVRQFKLENAVFPQQTTADQWFDEAQFESYRRLGHLSAHSLLRQLSLGRPNAAGVRAVFKEASVQFDPRSPFKEQHRQLTEEAAEAVFRLLRLFPPNFF